MLENLRGKRKAVCVQGLMGGAAAILLPSLGYAASQTTWTGNTSTAWDVAGNWNAGAPGYNTDATIGGVGTVITQTSGTYPTTHGVTFNGTGGATFTTTWLQLSASGTPNPFIRVSQQNQSNPYTVGQIATSPSTATLTLDVASGSTLKIGQSNSTGLPYGIRLAVQGGGTVDLVSQADASRLCNALDIASGSTYIHEPIAGRSTPYQALTGAGRVDVKQSYFDAYASGFAFTGEIDTWQNTNSGSGTGTGTFRFVKGQGTSVTGGNFVTHAASLVTQDGLNYYGLRAEENFTFTGSKISGNGQVVLRDGGYWTANNVKTGTMVRSEISPGIGTGILNIQGNLAFADDTTKNKLIIDKTGAGNVAGTDYDQLNFMTPNSQNIKGTLTGLSNLDLVVNIPDSLGSLAVAGDTLRVINGTSTNLSGASFNSVKVYYGASLLPASNYSMSYGNGFADITINQVPEPAVVSLVALGAIGLLARRRVRMV